jgi:TonB family protein
MAPQYHSPQMSRLFAVCLVLSVMFHSVMVLGVVVGTWLWGRAVYYRPASHTVSLLEAPIAIRPLTAAEARQYLPDTAQQPPPKKPKATAQKRAEKPHVATAHEARARIARLRARQARRAQEQQHVEQAQQQAAADRIAALRLGVHQHATATDSAPERASRLQRIRLQAYQALVREKIIAAWILPLPPAETHDLHAMVFLRVGRTGQVAQLKLLQSSGHALFDASFLHAFKRASPLPTLPADYEGEFLDIELRFSARDT